MIVGEETDLTTRPPRRDLFGVFPILIGLSSNMVLLFTAARSGMRDRRDAFQGMGGSRRRGRARGQGDLMSAQKAYVSELQTNFFGPGTLLSASFSVSETPGWQ